MKLELIGRIDPDGSFAPYYGQPGYSHFYVFRSFRKAANHCDMHHRGSLNRLLFKRHNKPGFPQYYQWEYGHGFVVVSDSSSLLKHYIKNRADEFLTRTSRHWSNRPTTGSI